ncbi:MULTISPECIES: HicB family protein [unclassified Lysinibacillus]|jgi:predicted RNase H-like HicB family nuclease|uniref:HicB family protein n=1 Tax=unclassified Lysinibacillus TaxID=2636778 RepID=UPI00382AA142
MKNVVVYPVVISPLSADGFHLVTIPDIDGITQGETIAEAIEYARDYIGNAIAFANEPINKPNTVPFTPKEKDIVTLVDVDIEAHKRALDLTPVKKTLTIPSYLNDLGIKQGINFSQTLTDALKDKLV